MYVSNPWVLSCVLRLVHNGSHPSPWRLGDPQKVIHIDTIFILVYIHTQVSPVALIYYSSSAHARHTISGSPSVRLDLGMLHVVYVCALRICHIHISWPFFVRSAAHEWTSVCINATSEL